MSLIIENGQIGYRKKRILTDVSLPEIPAGSLVAIVGPNAVGKSTLLKSLAGVLPFDGSVTFNDLPLSLMTHRQRMLQIGYLPQALPLANTLVAYELVYSAARASAGGLSPSEIEARIEVVFDQLGIRSLALTPMIEMSGGQRQMVGLAQVLVRQPKLLLLDEPTSALDLHWQLNVLQAIREEVDQRDAIACVASHDLNLSLRFCDHVLMLAKGRVLAFGAPTDVLTPERLKMAYGIEGRVEACSQGYPIVLADRPAQAL
ncbi:Fe(3+) dicitrate transport ATP-binding protein FecE [BD1-7 clade bacterium]|uniref:Fe(3+) dicitrate transport ATP-binding protein FecE n=1 Tax=BD1-7 clade bacterium TaxID=2029982 RepID=A0A5S9PH89_9GAMM|nr:Fe(3+) dicitrate transport ATP-binding protein FecE [BD1-7 clade bacterium]